MVYESLNNTVYISSCLIVAGQRLIFSTELPSGVALYD